MGAAPSATPTATTDANSMAKSLGPNKTEEDIIYFLMPVYYTASPLLPHEKELAIASWKQIAGGHAAEFWRLKKEKPEEIPCCSPMQFFGNQFYIRLQNIHPTCRSLFYKGTMKQGEALLRMMAFIVANLDDDAKLVKTMTALVTSHNKLGVKAVEYNIFGEVLFWVLKRCLGDAYDEATHGAWIKIYSKILSIVIPLVVRHEVTHKPHYYDVKHKRMATSLGQHVTTLDNDIEANGKVLATSAAETTHRHSPQNSSHHCPVAQ